MANVVKITRSVVEEMLDNKGKILACLFSNVRNVVAIEFNKNLNLNATYEEGVFWNTHGSGMITHSDPVCVSTRRVGKNRIVMNIDVLDLNKKFINLSNDEYGKHIVNAGKKMFSDIINKGIYVMDWKYANIQDISNENIDQTMMSLKSCWHAKDVTLTKNYFEPYHFL